MFLMFQFVLAVSRLIIAVSFVATLILCDRAGAKGTSPSADPQQYRIQAQLLINGKIVSQPVFITVLDESAEVTQSDKGGTEKMRMSVVTHRFDVTGDELKLDMDLEYISGKRTIRAKPQVIATSGTEATMQLEESHDNEKVQLKVLARPVMKSVVK
jgi:hypothetical protein